MLEIPPAPWRLYFPDAVVFQERVEALLTKVETRMGEPVFAIAPNALGTARDALEIAAAVFLLHDASPARTASRETRGANPGNDLREAPKGDRGVSPSFVRHRVNTAAEVASLERRMGRRNEY